MLRQNQFGGSIGGPVRRDRTFFFFNYQGTRIRQQSLITFFPPTQQERQGIFAAPITDPTTGQPFLNNTIPPDRFDPLAKNILDAYIPLPNLPDGRNNIWLSQPVGGNDYTAKVDHQFNESNRLSFRFYRNDATDSNRPAGHSTASGLLGKGTNLVQSENLKYTKIFSPRLLNEATVSHLRLNFTGESGPERKSPKDLGGNFNYDGPDPMLPTAIVSGRFTFAPALLIQEPEDTFTLSDKLTWMHGRHSLSAGALIERGSHLTRAQFVSAGQFTFSGAFTGNVLADYLIGRPSSLYAQSWIEDASRSGKYQFFAQDDFKINARLTLNLGLRYELNTPWVQVQDHTGTVVMPARQSQKIPKAPPGLVYPGDPGIPRGLIPIDKNNFAPRIGLAWDPTGRGRTAIRAAFGVFTQYVGAMFSSTPNQVQPYLVPISTVPTSFSDPYDVANGGIDPFPYVADLQNPTFFYPMQAFMIDPAFREGYIEQWNFNIQHQFSSVLVKAGYYGLMGHKLASLREANQAVFGPGATAANAQQRRPFYPQYYGSIAHSLSDANSNYNALQVSVDKRFSRGYTLQLAYTFSKAIDTRSSPVTGAQATIQDGNNTRSGERGLSSFDQRHILAVNGIWELPFMKGNRFLGGWRLAGLTRWTSGSPFSVYSGMDRALIGGGRSVGPQRLDLIGDWRLDPNRPHGELVAKYFDTSAFALPEIGKFGNSGRNIIIGPGYSNTDLSLQKRFKLPGERGDIEFRADFFNLFNQVNFGAPSSWLGEAGGVGVVNTRTSPAFGRILSARDARIVQLALRFDF